MVLPRERRKSQFADACMLLYASRSADLKSYIVRLKTFYRKHSSMRLLHVRDGIMHVHTVHDVVQRSEIVKMTRWMVEIKDLKKQRYTRSLRGNNKPISLSISRLQGLLLSSTSTMFFSMARVVDSVRSCRIAVFHSCTPGVVRHRCE
jgi:hypothetical protein